MIKSTPEQISVKRQLRANGLTEIIWRVGEGEMTYFVRPEIAETLKLPKDITTHIVNYKKFRKLDMEMEKRGYQPIEVANSVYVVEKETTKVILQDLKSTYAEDILNRMLDQVVEKIYRREKTGMKLVRQQ